MNDNFTLEEKLFRAVKQKPVFWNNKLGRPSSAIFKDSKGISVDRDGGRSEDDIISKFQKQFVEELRAIVYVTVQNCNDIETYLRYCPVTEGQYVNKFHAEIHRSQDEIPLTQSQAKRLLKNSVIAFEKSS